MMSQPRSAPHVITLILLTGVSTLSLNMFVPSLNHIAESFDADYALVSVSIAGYLAMTAALQMILGPLSDRFGRRPVLLWSLLIFVLASLGCLFATNIWVFLTFRMLQGAIIAGAALARTIVRDTLPPSQAASRLGYIAMAMAIAPMLGPMLGGWLDQVFGWRSSFVAFTVFGGLLFYLTWVDLGETNLTPSLTLSHQLRSYPALLGSADFWAYSLCATFSTGAFFAFIAGASIVAETVFAMQPSQVGVYIGSITGGYLIGSTIAGRFAGHYRLGTMMMAGRLVACVGLSTGLVLFTFDIVHVLSLFGATIFVGLGNGITMPSSAVGSMSVRSDLVGSAAGLSGAMVVGGGAVVTMLTGIVVTGPNGATALLSVMLIASFLGLLSALWIVVGERQRRPNSS